MASPTFIAASNLTVNGLGIVNLPAGIATGDLLIAVVYSPFSNDANFTAASGWTQIGTKIDNGNYDCLRVFRRVVQGGDGSSDNWQPYTPGNPGEVSIVAFSGADGTTPIDANAQTTWQSTSATTWTAPTATATIAGTTLLAIFAGGGQPQTFSGIGSMTQRVNWSSASSGKNIAIFSEALASSGASGTRSVTSSVSREWGAMTVILKGAGGGGGATVRRILTLGVG